MDHVFLKLTQQFKYWDSSQILELSWLDMIGIKVAALYTVVVFLDSNVGNLASIHFHELSRTNNDKILSPKKV